MPDAPTGVAWTAHAWVKAQVLGLTRADIERWIEEQHERRERNHGAADWRITTGRVVVVYNHPDGEDRLVARVVTVWRRR